VEILAIRGVGDTPRDLRQNGDMTDEGPRRPGFWARQFAPEVTLAQHVFDAFFGVLLPVLCLVADPIVFRSGHFMGGGMFARYAVPAYLFLGGSILAMALWLVTRRLAVLFVGPFFVGALVALGVGVVLLPFSLLMALVGIGLLGLVPFGTAVTFLRNAVRAGRAAAERHPDSRLAGVALLTAALTVGVPAGAHVYVQRGVSRALTAVVSDDARAREDGVTTLRRYALLLPEGTGLDRIVQTWHAERDPARKARLAEAYRAVTGGDVASRWGRLND
jgi:hypothetical protein